MRGIYPAAVVDGLMVGGYWNDRARSIRWSRTRREGPLYLDCGGRSWSPARPVCPDDSGGFRRPASLQEI